MEGCSLSLSLLQASSLFLVYQVIQFCPHIRLLYMDQVNGWFCTFLFHFTVDSSAFASERTRENKLAKKNLPIIPPQFKEVRSRIICYSLRSFFFWRTEVVNSGPLEGAEPNSCVNRLFPICLQGHMPQSKQKPIIHEVLCLKGQLTLNFGSCVPS